MASNFSILDLLTINTAQLAIAAYLYPNHLFPRRLTTEHISAIRINVNNHFVDPPSPTLLINNTAVGHDPVVLVHQALAYRHFRTAQDTASGFENFRDLFFRYWLDVTPGMNLIEYTNCVSNSDFMDRLENEGETAQREVLEKGWTAYQHVPEQIKRDLGLLDD